MNKEIKKNIKRILPLSLCCIIPILLILSAPVVSTFSPRGATIMSFIAPFICPLVMGGAFFFLFRGNKPCCSQETSTSK